MTLEAPVIGLPETYSPLKVAVLENCNFSIVEKDINGYKVLELPESLRALFESGFHAIRIQSTDIAASLPSYAGKSPFNHSLLPHQDHHPDDPRRFLAFSQGNNIARGSSTYLVPPETVSKALPEILEHFGSNIEDMKVNSKYDKSFQITLKQFKRCFKEGGLKNVAEEILNREFYYP